MLSLHHVMVFSFSKPKACCMTSLRLSARYRWPYVIPKCTASSTSQSGVSSRSSDLVEKEYADLQLKSLYVASDIGHVRIRQHVNPLSASFSVPVQSPDWKEIFTDSTLPLMVDIGCGSGRFLIWLAKNSPLHRNYLGLEIRQKVLVQSDVLEVALDMRNVFDACTDVFEHVDRIDPPPFSCDSDGWLQCNPMGIRTEREIHAELEGATIYRRMYQKTRHHV